MLKSVVEATEDADVAFVAENSSDAQKLNDASIQFIFESEFFLNCSAESMVINGVGPSYKNQHRAHVHYKYLENGILFDSVLAKNALITGSINLKEDVQILTGVIINNGVEVGRGSVINTGAIVEHDCKIGCHVHIAPGAVVCGDVNIGSHSYIGPGAIVGHGVSIGNNVVVGANSTILSNVESHSKIYGVHHV